MNQYDSIVIGAGHNGLVCATYLAQGGQRVLVLEAADTPGGLAAGREFHPGFHASVAHSVNHLSQVINAGFNMSFFDYLNSHRIDHARGLLSEIDGSSGAILKVAFTVGFHSNSAF